MLKGNIFYIKDQVMEVDLILLDFQGFDVILRIDWLTLNYTSVDCSPMR